MCLTLWHKRSEFVRMGYILSGIVIYFLSRGLITVRFLYIRALELTEFGIFAANLHLEWYNLVWAAFHFADSQVYVNALLALLNEREHRKGKMLAKPAMELKTIELRELSAGDIDIRVERCNDDDDAAHTQIVVKKKTSDLTMTPWLTQDVVGLLEYSLRVTSRHSNPAPGPNTVRHLYFQHIPRCFFQIATPDAVPSKLQPIIARTRRVPSINECAAIDTGQIPPTGAHQNAAPSPSVFCTACLREARARLCLWMVAPRHVACTSWVPGSPRLQTLESPWFKGAESSGLGIRSSISLTSQQVLRAHRARPQAPRGVSPILISQIADTISPAAAGPPCLFDRAVYRTGRAPAVLSFPSANRATKQCLRRSLALVMLTSGLGTLAAPTPSPLPLSLPILATAIAYPRTSDIGPSYVLNPAEESPRPPSPKGRPLAPQCRMPHAVARVHVSESESESARAARVRGRESTDRWPEIRAGPARRGQKPEGRRLARAAGGCTGEGDGRKRKRRHSDDADDDTRAQATHTQGRAGQGPLRAPILIARDPDPELSARPHASPHSVIASIAGQPARKWGRTWGKAGGKPQPGRSDADERLAVHNRLQRNAGSSPSTALLGLGLEPY
ncbi:predicted protein [Postia placenta Mad-698-R]|nr:predicted protein [Postia placenta Mad-698-R]